jgi:di/tricarboxylate transporter
MRRSQTINAFGFAMTALVLAVSLITKFTQGAWISPAATAAIYAVMSGIRRHYQRVSDELQEDDNDPPIRLPSRNAELGND